MSKTEYRVVAAGGEAGSRRILATFTRELGGEESARAFAQLTKDSHEKFRAAATTPLPALQLEIEVVLTMTQTTRIIRL